MADRPVHYGVAIRRDLLNSLSMSKELVVSRSKAVVSKVSTSTSTPEISSDVAELKDMVKALLLDKKNQNQPSAPAPVKAVEQSCVTCGGAHSYRNFPASRWQQLLVINITKIHLLSARSKLSIMDSASFIF
ncbi:hypothetical protein Tco_0852983 [Tanacetum coccineum]